MDVLVPNNLLWLALYVIVALFIGYAVGSRHSRKQQREMLRDYNQQSLDMLDVKTEHAKLSKFLGQSKRKDRLLKLTLKQLKEANQATKLLQGRLANIEKQHYIKSSRLRLLATHATAKARTATTRARKATTLATHATSRIKQLEKNLPSAQTINAPPPKSYGQAASVPVRVVDQHPPETQHNSVTRVSNRDSARFTRMRPSNEEQRFNSANLQAIEGIGPSVEKKLNQVGIHRVEQLANMSDSDLLALSVVFDANDIKDNQLNYTAAWKGGARRLLGQS